MPSAGATSAAGAVSGQLPEHMQIQRDNVICGPDLNYHVSRDFYGSQQNPRLLQLTSSTSAD